MDIRIGHLPTKLKKLAMQRAREHGIRVDDATPISSFHWASTEEGDKFWRTIRDTGIFPTIGEEMSYDIY